MKIRALRLLWRAALRLRQWWLLDLRCHGTAPAETWIPGCVEVDCNGCSMHPMEGYYRSGIQRRYCQRFAGHRGQCLAPIDALGHDVAGGAPFDPEPVYHEILRKEKP